MSFSSPIMLLTSPSNAQSQPWFYEDPLSYEQIPKEEDIGQHVLSNQEESVLLFNENQVDALIKEETGNTNLPNSEDLIENPKQLEIEKRRAKILENSLFWWTENGNASQVKILLNMGVNPNVRNILNETPLHVAACRGHLKVMKHLLNNGANKYAIIPNKGARTPLNYALLAGKYLAVKLLVKRYQYDVNYKKYSRQKMPLEDACRNGNPKILRFLFARGASVRLASKAIFKAIPHPENLRLLISMGADCNVVKRQKRCYTEDSLDGKKKYRYSRKGGATPLHYAANACSKEAIKILLDAGAKKNVRDYSNKTAFNILQSAIKYYDERQLITPENALIFKEMEQILFTNLPE